MEIIGSLENVNAFVLDVDDTCYSSPAYKAHQREVKYAKLGELMGLSPEAAKQAVKDCKKDLQARHNRSIALTETIIELGITAQQWIDLRQNNLQPELHICPDQEFVNLISRAAKRYVVAFATNSPEKLGRRILGRIGIIPEDHGCYFLGTDTVGLYKPNPEFFLAACNLMKVLPQVCVSIGNRLHTDCHPALEAGFAGSIHVPEGREQTVTFLKQILA